MDSNQEAANLAQIKSYRLNVWLVVLAILQIVSPYFVIWYTQRNQTPPTTQAGVFMVTGWIPIILLLLSSGVTATALLIVATKRLRTKRLAAEVTRLEGELTKSNSDLEHERGKPKFVALDDGKTEKLQLEIQGLSNELIENSEHFEELTRLMESQNSGLIRERTRLEKDLLNVTRSRQSLEGSLEISRREVAEVKDAAKAQRDTYELTFKGMAKELEAAQSWKEQYDEGHQAAIRLKTLNEQYEKQINNLKSDAEEARKEKLAAASNLDGVETDRNNYRTWFNELSWLKPTIKEQQRDTSNHVQVLAARPCLLNLKRRIVIIELVIRNESFFDITIMGDKVAGRLSTEKNGLLHDPAKARIDLIHHPIENLKPTKEATFALIQPLLKTEAENIEDAIADGDGCFWLGNLNIPISVQNADPLHIDSKPLRINSDVENVYFREFGALTFDGEPITPRELIRDVEALPFPERARIYRELSKAYGESLWRLNEAKEKKEQ